MQQKIILTVVLASVLGLGSFGYYMIQKHGKILPFIGQLTRNQVNENADIQPKSQKQAHYVGSQQCKKCHEDQFEQWKHSYHSKMIQDVTKVPTAILADFMTLPDNANFKKKDVVYTIGGKFKQRYMMSKELNGTQDYVIGNYQWNTQLKKWQPYSTTKDWYHDGFEENNSKVGTSKTCDGCHFTGFMSQEKRIEPAISCESCHGPGSEHAKSPEENDIYIATNADPKRTTEVCLQCHMRNRDKRLEHTDIHSIFGDVRDYPKGFEPGKPLSTYKMKAPFDHNESDEFFGNGVGKKNRTQGNEYVQSMMYKHGITCVNCHDPHVLDSTSDKPLGDALCMKCHSLGSPIGPHQNSIQEHTRHKVGSSGSSCIECHMPKTGKHLKESPLTVRTHVFGFITPAESKKYKVANACTNCHKDKNLDWADKNVVKWGMNQWTK
jgi:hypothetical protein